MWYYSGLSIKPNCQPGDHGTWLRPVTCSKPIQYEWPYQQLDYCHPSICHWYTHSTSAGLNMPSTGWRYHQQGAFKTLNSCKCINHCRFFYTGERHKLLLSKVLSPKEFCRLTLHPTSSRFGGSRLMGKCVLMKRGDFIAFSTSYPGWLICCTMSSFSELPAFSLRSSAFISSCTNKLNLPKKTKVV